LRSTRGAGVAVGVLVAALLVIAAVAVPLGTVGPRPPDAVSPSPSLATAGTSTAATRVPATPTVSAVPNAPSPSPTPVPETGIDVGQLAPDFELRTPEGEPVSLADFRGRPVWLNFWAPWCPACRTEMPRLEGFYVEQQDDGLVIPRDWAFGELPPDLLASSLGTILPRSTP
jgi:cytochrome oxidase Cu insertion factor (SCO1/SenC/PrrC family)